MMQQHCQLEQLVDYARGLVEDQDQCRQVEAHLEACGSCRASARGFAVLATTPAAPEPPPDAMAAARAIFTHPHPAQPVRGSVPRRTSVRLLYDSAATPLLAGMRLAGTRRPRRLLFEAGEYFLDVDVTLAERSQPGPGARTVVVGQLVDREEPSRRLPGICVQLESAGDGVVGRASSNPFGEFQLECELRPGLRLSLPAGDGERIEVALPRPAESA